MSAAQAGNFQNAGLAQGNGGNSGAPMGSPAWMMNNGGYGNGGGGRSAQAANAYTAGYQPGATATASTGATGGTKGGAAAAPAGNYTTSIDANPIYNDQQIQNQVNQSNASVANQAQNQGARLSQNLASRGFGATGGGLGAALRAALGTNSSSNAARGEQDLRWNAAQGNAQHLLGAQQARAQEGLGLGNMLLQQRGQDISSENANRQNILNLLMSTMGSMS